MTPEAPGAVPADPRAVQDEHAASTRPATALLASRSDPYFRGFDLKLPDYWRECSNGSANLTSRRPRARCRR